MGMEILGGLGAFGGSLVGYVVPFLFVLTIVVFFHELGHFLMARWCGIKVLVFSIGFGPEIAGFNDRYGTRWKISAVPLGGYVKFFGDENAASVPDLTAAAAMNEADKKDSFHVPTGRSRALVVAAGPIANFALAIAIFAIIFMTVGKQTTSARVDTVQAGSAAQTAGFQPGDLVLTINGEKIESFSDMQRIVSISAGLEAGRLFLPHRAPRALVVCLPKRVMKMIAKMAIASAKFARCRPAATSARGLTG